MELWDNEKKSKDNFKEKRIYYMGSRIVDDMSAKSMKLLTSFNSSTSIQWLFYDYLFSGHYFWKLFLSEWLVIILMLSTNPFNLKTYTKSLTFYFMIYEKTFVFILSFFFSLLKWKILLLKMRNKWVKWIREEIIIL